MSGFIYQGVREHQTSHRASQQQTGWPIKHLLPLAMWSCPCSRRWPVRWVLFWGQFSQVKLRFPLASLTQVPSQQRGLAKMLPLGLPQTPLGSVSKPVSLPLHLHAHPHCELPEGGNQILPISVSTVLSTMPRTEHVKFKFELSLDDSKPQGLSFIPQVFVGFT